jgi:small GTP-binding protein
MIQKKICMVGAFGVGKTSLVARYVHSIFSEKYQTTVGVKIDKKQLVVDGQDVMLMLWDLAGEDALTQIKPAHLKGASGYLLVVDGTRRNTLETAVNLQQRAQEAAGEVAFLVILNKADVKDTWQVTDGDLQPLRDRGWTLLEASAKNGERVEEMFHELARRMLRKDDDAKQSATSA